VIRELAAGRFIANADNVLLLGPPGVGKTHLAVGLGLRACALGYRTMFLTASSLVASLTRAHQDRTGNSSDSRRARLAPYHRERLPPARERSVLLRGTRSHPFASGDPLGHRGLHAPNLARVTTWD
jgi:hypothetical protein